MRCLPQKADSEFARHLYTGTPKTGLTVVSSQKIYKKNWHLVPIAYWYAEKSSRLALQNPEFQFIGVPLMGLLMNIHVAEFRQAGGYTGRATIYIEC